MTNSSSSNNNNNNNNNNNDNVLNDPSSPRTESTGVRRQRTAAEHITIASRRSFDATHDALRVALPYSDKAALPARLGAAAGPAARRAVLASLPALAILAPPQNFGGLAAVLRGARPGGGGGGGGGGARALQFDIGNPYVAARLAGLDMAAVLYTPVRVVLREVEVEVGGGDTGRAVFEYDSPVASLGQLAHGEVDPIAARLEDAVHKTLCAAAGLGQEGADGKARTARAALKSMM
jgi:hypothetical protein